jgi:hypothetical protein
MEEHANRPRLGEFLRASGRSVSKNLDDLERRWREFLRTASAE